MTSTAFSLIISSFVTSAQKSISLLDAIVVVYGTAVVLLPQKSSLTLESSPPFTRPRIGYWTLRDGSTGVTEEPHALSPLTPAHHRELDSIRSHLLLRVVRLDYGTYLRFWTS